MASCIPQLATRLQTRTHLFVECLDCVHCRNPKLACEISELAVRWQDACPGSPSDAKLIDLGCKFEITAANTIMETNSKTHSDLPSDGKLVHAICHLMAKQSWNLLADGKFECTPILHLFSNFASCGDLGACPIFVVFHNCVCCDYLDCAPKISEFAIIWQAAYPNLPSDGKSEYILLLGFHNCVRCDDLDLAI